MGLFFCAEQNSSLRKIYASGFAGEVFSMHVAQDHYDFICPRETLSGNGSRQS